MGGMINLASFRDRWRDFAMVTDVWRQSVKIGVFHLYSMLRRFTTDGKIATRALSMTLLRLIKNLVKFVPV